MYTFNLLSLGRDIINVASTIACFLTRLSKIEPTGPPRLSLPRYVCRSICRYTCVRSLFTVAFPRDVNCIPAENAPEMHRRVFSSVVDRLRWPRFEKSPVDACKKRADVDRYRRDKLAPFSLAGKIAKRIAALDVLLRI